MAPPIYDFALYDLFLKPFALCRLGAWLQACGFRVRLVNGLDFRDPPSLARLGATRREARGTGKFFRQVIPRPAVLGPVARHFARYGMLAESLERELAREEPDLVLVSSGMTYWYPGVVEAIDRVKRLHPRAPVVLGGPYATLLPEHACRVTQADHIVAGEAMPPLRPILARLGLPHEAAWDEAAFWPAPGVDWGAGVLRLNRGCPFRCAYCASPVLCSGFHAGDPAAAFAQVQMMHRRFGTDSFAFYDDALLAGPSLPSFLELLLASGPKLSLYAPNAVHASFLDRRIAALLYQAGLREVCLGVESSLEEFHSGLDRKLDVRRLPEALATLAEAGFRGRDITAYILAGLPGQRWEEVEESLRRTAALGIRVQVTEYSPVPGTALWPDAVRRSGLPLAEEPLTHNNTLLPMQWEGFRAPDLHKLKSLARELSRAQTAAG